MTTEDNKSVVRRLDEFLNKGDLAVAEELFAPDFTNHNPGRGMTPDREGLKQYVTAIRTAFPDVTIIADDLICEGDKVVVRVTISGTHRGDFAGIPPTGKEVSVMAISILRLAEGKIVERWNVSDELGLLQQLGIIPSMG